MREKILTFIEKNSRIDLKRAGCYIRRRRSTRYE